MTTARTRREEQVRATRDALLNAAERLFAEYGVHAVTIRQISAAAGQGNNTAVNYHFGAKTELVRAIIRKHGEQTENTRARMIAEIGDSTNLRDWMNCLVRPVTDHLAGLGTPTWYARFNTLAMADPALQAIMSEETVSTSPSMRTLLDGMYRCLPDLPPEILAERVAIVRHLITQMCADRERALAEGAPTPRASWDDTATGLVDAIVALWNAPFTRR